MKKTTIWLTKTAMMIALLLVLQFITKGFGQYVTGSCVNFVLAMTVYIGGLSSGIVVALLSPIFAFLFGIGPAFLLITPCISAGNLIFILVLSFLWLRQLGDVKKRFLSIVSVCLAALGKFSGLYFLVVKLVLPTLGLPDNKLNMMSLMFSYPQLVTALIGGIIATVVALRVPVKKAV